MTPVATLRQATVGVALIVALAACGSAAPPTGAPTAIPTLVPTAIVTAVPTAIPTLAISAAPAKVLVDLVFTGSHPLVAKGSAGQCQIGHQADGTAVFWFYASEADYPEFGSGGFFQMEESANGTTTINEDGTVTYATPLPGEPATVVGTKAALGAAGYLGYTAGSIVLSADHLSVQVDVDLSGSDAEHVSGTVTCP